MRAHGLLIMATILMSILFVQRFRLVPQINSSDQSFRSPATTTTAILSDESTAAAPSTNSSDHDAGLSTTLITLSPLIESRYMDVSSTVLSSRDDGTVLFWHVPKSAGTSLNDLILCLRLVFANEWATVLRDEPLQILGPNQVVMPPQNYSLDILERQPHHRYVNVDTTTLPGLATAGSLGYAAKQPAQVVITPFPIAAAKYLLNDNYDGRGRLFSILRHPVDRAVSMFYYLMHASWETTYQPQYKNMTLWEYCNSDRVERNWMTSILSQQLLDDDDTALEKPDKPPHLLTRDDLDRAKLFMERKMILGLTEHMSESLGRFGKAFGWCQVDDDGDDDIVTDNYTNRWPKCYNDSTARPANQYHHLKAAPGSREWNKLVEMNEYDMELYEHAERLFQQQATLFR